MTTGLLGRSPELELLGDILKSVRAGDSRVFVLRGEAGVGKSALLDAAAADAKGFRVARAGGAESEMELAFAALHQLCAPMLGHLDRLPPPQQDALATALGFGAGATADRYLVGLAVLNLLAELAEERPLVCLIDDAQWLDRASAQALGFPGRTIRGLNDSDARQLLEAAIPGRLDGRVRDRIVAESRGNPLAILELPRSLSATELAGGYGRPDARPLASQIEQGFVRRIRALSDETRLLLLTAAAEPIGDVGLLRRATNRLALDAGAETEAEAAGLIEFGTRVRFRHPLVRSAAYRAASITERRTAHRALADATDPQTDPDRRVWHRAHAARQPDEAVASALERSAERAKLRGGVAAAAAFLERAAELTPEPGTRSARAVAAAQAKLEAGGPDEADALIAAAEIGPLTEQQRAALTRLRAQIVFTRRRGSEALPLLLDVARRLEAVDGRLSREAYLEALAAAIFVGRLGTEPGERAIAEAADEVRRTAAPPGPIDLLLDGIATRYTDGYGPAVAPLRRALEAFRDAARSDDADIMRWLWLACPVAPEPVAAELWDDNTWHLLASRAVSLARQTGALGVLPLSLSYLAGFHVHAGEFTAAAELIDEADRITSAIGNAPMRYTSLALVAWTGDEAGAAQLIAAARQDALARGEGRAIGLIGYATAVLYNGLGRYEHALTGARLACEYDDLGFYGWSLVENIEAAVRSDERQTAMSALEQLDERAEAVGTDWALGVRARSHALLSSNAAAEALYREAIARLAGSRIVVHLARAHLVYGEWLRREQRRVDAREQLRTALARLEGIGAEAFAERARRELVATGEHVRQRTDAHSRTLTPQEAQIARMAAAGGTNSEIGIELFISARTVEYHLSKVFTKLGVASRRDLGHALTWFETEARPHTSTVGATGNHRQDR